MSFDVQKMMNEKYSPRTEEIEVPDLKGFFPDGEPPVIVVRGLEGEELARVNEHVEKYRALGKLIEGFISSNQTEKISAIKEAMGFTEKVPDDFAKRLQMLVMGAVSPQFAQNEAVKFAKVYPVEFYLLTNTIIRLTGQGSLPGELKPSIKEQT